MEAYFQALFQKEYDSLQVGQLPSVAFKQYDFFVDNQTNTVVSLDDVVGISY